MFLVMAQITSGVNACCYQPCSLWRHKQMLFCVIRLLPGGKYQTFRQVIEQISFSSISLLSLHVLRSFFFCILFCMNRVIILYLNCFHSNSTLKQADSQSMPITSVRRSWPMQIVKGSLYVMKELLKMTDVS